MKIIFVNIIYLQMHITIIHMYIIMNLQLNTKRSNTSYIKYKLLIKNILVLYFILNSMQH